MKYYRLHGQVASMEDRLFKVLLDIEPTVKELTKQDYENSMGIRPKGQPKKEIKDVGEPVVKDSTEEVETPLRAGTKKDLIETLKGRGFGAGELNRKTKQQLIEML